MEQQQPTSGCSWLPSDLTTEILLRLPAKSIVRFRCVLKLWLSITTDPRFIKSFETTRPSLLLCSIENHNLFVTSTPHHSIRSFSSNSQPIKKYPMKLPGEDCDISNMDSVHGLICIEDLDSNTPLVWNPSTDQFLLLPKPPNMNSKYLSVFLGYDSVQGKHKLVCLPCDNTCHFCRVFTLRSGQESWRTVGTYDLKHRLRSYAYGQCINGVIYYLAYNAKGYRETVIMSFDVRFETFRMIKLPSRIHHDVLISYEGRLACLDRDNKRRLWILEDADKHKWSFQDFRVPLHTWTLNVSIEENNYPYNRFELKGCTHAGEFVYVPSRIHESSSFIVFYDPVQNSCRRLKFKGIVDELNMYVFPNHIETLMSL